MSWPDMMTPWETGNAPPDPLRITILGALAYTALAHRATVEGAVFCADCGPELCPDHAADLDFARTCEDAHTAVAAGTAQWRDLKVKLISEMN